jgi:hypothetical protein
LKSKAWSAAVSADKLNRRRSTSRWLVVIGILLSTCAILTIAVFVLSNPLNTAATPGDPTGLIIALILCPMPFLIVGIISLVIGIRRQRK